MHACACTSDEQLVELDVAAIQLLFSLKWLNLSNRAAVIHVARKESSMSMTSKYKFIFGERRKLNHNLDTLHVDQCELELSRCAVIRIIASEVIYIIISGRTSCRKYSKCFYVYLNIRPMRYFFLCNANIKRAMRKRNRLNKLAQYNTAYVHVRM